MKQLFSAAKLPLALIFALTAAHATVILSTTTALTNADPIQAGRLSRNNVPQDWVGSEPFPGVINPTTSYFYRTFTVNVGLFNFIQIEIDDNLINLFASAYDTAYLPDSSGSPNFGFDTNWRGDAGASGNFLPGDPRSFQVIESTNKNLVVVVSTVNAGTLGLNEPFTLTVEGFCDSAFTDGPCSTAVTPEPGTIAAGFGGLMIILGFRRLRR